MNMEIRIRETLLIKRAKETNEVYGMPLSLIQGLVSGGYATELKSVGVQIEDKRISLTEKGDKLLFDLADDALKWLPEELSSRTQSYLQSINSLVAEGIGPESEKMYLTAEAAFDDIKEINWLIRTMLRCKKMLASKAPSNGA
jgi:hypothetical protein